MKADSYCLTLGWPPSVNHYWVHSRGRMFVGKKGQAYRQAVAIAARSLKTLAGKLSMTLVLDPPDKRRRDIDNILKALLDAMQHAGVYHDDNQIKELHVKMRDYCKEAAGTIHVRIDRLESK